MKCWAEFLQCLSSNEGPTTPPETVSQGEIGKVASAQKTAAADASRPQRARVSFWGKWRQAEKKINQEHPATPPEPLDFRPDQDAAGGEISGGKVTEREGKKRRRKEADVVEEHNGHIFKATQCSIPAYCEFCSSLIWIMDKASVCKLCKHACHRKCCLKTTTKCPQKNDPELSSQQFGVELSCLTSEEQSVPLVFQKLISYIEIHGLYTEGIYRKSGSASKIKELRQALDTDIESVNLGDYNIHVIASVFKQWLRDLPNPLMTFEFYEEFLRAVGLPERKEAIHGVSSVMSQLSQSYLSTLEQLIMHLARIALEEDRNRMSANALAIVFAPCLLRNPDTSDPLRSAQDVSQTISCIELIVLEERKKHLAQTMVEIQHLA